MDRNGYMEYGDPDFKKLSMKTKIKFFCLTGFFLIFGIVICSLALFVVLHTIGAIALSFYFYPEQLFLASILSTMLFLIGAIFLYNALFLKVKADWFLEGK